MRRASLIIGLLVTVMLLTSAFPPALAVSPAGTSTGTLTGTLTSTVLPNTATQTVVTKTLTLTSTLTSTVLPTKTVTSLPNTATQTATQTVVTKTLTLTSTLTSTVLPTKTVTVTSLPNTATQTATQTVTPTVIAKTLTPTTVRRTSTPSPIPTTPAPTVSPFPLNTPWLKVYFTNPAVTAVDNPNINASFAVNVLAALNAAKTSIDAASFDFNLPELVGALINAKNRGVAVRVVVDQVNGSTTLKASSAGTSTDFDALKAFQDAGITVVNGGRSNGLMHNKIIIIDGSLLFMGSWNLSYNDTFRNDNNILQITSQRLIANYQAKFNELFINKKFGSKALVMALNPQITLDGTLVENYFSPPDNVMDKIVAKVNAAQKSIKFIGFTYTHKSLSAAMIAKSQAGVQVQGVIENRGASQGAFVPLFCAGLPVKTDGNKYTMHHKYMIIDDQIVITGSYNWTQTADSANDDNILIIHNTSVAALYNQEFTRIYGLGKTVVLEQANFTCPTS